MFLRASLFIILLNFFCAYGQSPEEVQGLAHKAIDEGDYLHAEELLLRQVYFLQDDTLHADLNIEANLTLARIEAILGNNEKAYEHYHRTDLLISDQSCVNDSLRWSLFIEKMNFLISTGSAARAVVEMQSCKAFKKPDDVEYELKFLSALSFLMLDDTQSAREVLLEINPEDSVEIENAFALYEQDLMRYNPKKVAWLSRLLPGLGQVKAGKYKAALNSFLLVGGILTAGVYIGIVYTVFDGIIAASPFFFRYYKGGVAKAAMYANEKIDASRKKLIGEMVRVTGIKEGR